MNSALTQASSNTDDVMTPPISVLIADDHVLLAEAVAAALQAPPRNFRTHLTANLEETYQAIKSETHFDLIMLDLRMPGMLGLKSVKEVIAAAAPTKVVLLSGNADTTLVRAAVDEGGLGLIPKTLSLKSLVSVVEFVLSGQVFVPAEDAGGRKAAESRGIAKLSEREVSILRFTADGRTNKEIASALGLTEVTIKMHMRAICRKLNARNRAHAVTISNEYGLL
jgi:two-component system, NarL family, nitrate/nitrite response regulator NarL